MLCRKYNHNILIQDRIYMCGKGVNAFLLPMSCAVSQLMWGQREYCSIQKKLSVSFRNLRFISKFASITTVRFGY